MGIKDDVLRGTLQVFDRIAEDQQPPVAQHLVLDQLAEQQNVSRE